MDKSDVMPPGNNQDSEEWICSHCHKPAPFNDNNLMYVNDYCHRRAGLFQIMKELVCDDCDPRPKPPDPVGTAA